jgi:uncharacterized membrane protein
MPNKEAWKTILEHERLCWESECENAERLVNRMRMMSAIAAVVLGVGLFKFDWLYTPTDISRIGTGWVLFTIRILLVASLICLAVAFWHAMKPSRPRRKTHASHYMFLQDRHVTAMPTTGSGAAALILGSIYLAHRPKWQQKEK